jgi:hypothetical protein
MSDFVSVWNYDLLWNKAKLYVQRALDEEREDEMFPFWSALALEFLGRATLAYVHPVLLADPREGENILYTFGYSKSKHTPKSIPAKTVFDRCKSMVPDFTAKEFDICLAIIERRNEELHSGIAPFESFPTKLWLADYYRVSKLLLMFQNKELKDLFGIEGAAAEIMIKKVEDALIKSVKELIIKHRSDFEKLSEEEMDKSRLDSFLNIEKAHPHYKKEDICIACKGGGIITGELIKISDAKMKEDVIEQEFVILPTHFTCFSCGLKLTNHSQLNIAGYGGQYTIKEYYDPVDYHGSGEDPYDQSIEGYFDYGND